jgi:hypothetical protein
MECMLRVFENRVLKRAFWPKRDKVTGEWRKLHNKELYSSYSSPNIIRVIISKRQRLAGHVTHICSYSFAATYWVLLLEFYCVHTTIT